MASNFSGVVLSEAVNPDVLVNGFFTMTKMFKEIK